MTRCNNNNIIITMWFVLMCVCSLSLVGSTGTPEQDPCYQQGKARYEVLNAESRRPLYSECWTAALKQLQSGCKQLSDDVQYRLALSFANCHLEKTGRKTYPCSDNEELKDCMSRMDSDAYGVHAEFVTHTQNMCFFLEALQSPVLLKNHQLTFIQCCKILKTLLLSSLKLYSRLCS